MGYIKIDLILYLMYNDKLEIIKDRNDFLICRICKEKVYKIYDKQFDLNYYKCSNCEFIFVEDKGLPNQDIDLKVYNLHNNSFENEGYVNMFRDFIKKGIDPLNLKEAEVLEFGCGKGPVLARLLEEKKYLVDKYDKYFYKKRVFENKKYDLITSTEVIEHIKEPLEIFEFFKKHLKKDGYLVITTLFHDNDDEKFKDWWYRRDQTHISFFTVKTLKTICIILNLEFVYNDDKNIFVVKNI